MIIGDRLREIREAKKLSQGEIEQRTGLLRCHISRVENGHTVPAVSTLEKFAHALEVPCINSFTTAASRSWVSKARPKKKTCGALWDEMRVSYVN
jgi:transcriptional regulator with XRE-family HTH domain